MAGARYSAKRLKIRDNSAKAWRQAIRKLKNKKKTGTWARPGF
jgi:hypothetical protein